MSRLAAWLTRPAFRKCKMGEGVLVVASNEARDGVVVTEPDEFAAFLGVHGNLIGS